MKNAAPLLLRLSRSGDRKSAKLLSSDGDVSGGADFFDGGPVFGGNATLRPMLGNGGADAQETSEAAVAAEGADHFEVRPHAAELGTSSPIVKRNLVPSQNPIALPPPLGIADDSPRLQLMKLGRPAAPPEKAELMKRIGERLRWVREVHGKSQAEMGALFGISGNAWGKIELGKRLPDRFRLPEIVARLAISMEYLKDGSLDGVERSLAIHLAAAHPELAQQTNK